MIEPLLRGLPGLCLLVLVAINWPVVGQKAFEPVLTDPEILEIAAAAFAELGTPPCPTHGRQRICPLLLLEATQRFCSGDDKIDTLSLGCDEQRPRFLAVSSRFARVPHALKRRLVAANGSERQFDCRDGQYHRCAGDFDHDAAFADGWDSFRKIHPDLGGIAAISVPVISPSGRRAAIYVAVHCGGLCGFGFLLELERQPQGWRVLRKEMDWVS